MQFMLEPMSDPKKANLLPLFELNSGDGVDGAVIGTFFKGLHAGTHVLSLFRSLVHLPGEETIDYWIQRYHKCLSMHRRENVRSFWQRVCREARNAHAAYFAYGQQIEDYGYAVNEHGQLLILTEPFIARRVYNSIYREFNADPRYAALFPVHLTPEQPDAIRSVSAETIEQFASACESKLLDAMPAPRPQPKQNSPREQGGGSQGGGSVNQVQAFTGTEDEQQQRGRSQQRGPRGRSRSRSQSTEAYVKAGERFVGKMKAAKTPAEGDKIVKELYADVVEACGDDGQHLWFSQTLDGPPKYLFKRIAWFLKKRLTNGAEANWSPDCFRLMMLFKDIADAAPKDFAYTQIEGIDEALKEWRSGSKLAKWLKTACQSAYQRRGGNSAKKKKSGKTGNLAAAEEEDDSTIQSGSETSFGANLGGTTNGYLQG